MSYVDCKRLERVLKKGYYVNDLTTLYNDQGAVMCDKCNSRITTCCIHYKDLDLCIPCVDLIRVQQVSSEERQSRRRMPERRPVPEPDIGSYLKQLPYVTLMRSEIFEPTKPTPGMTTRMRASDISPRIPAHSIMTDMRISDTSSSEVLHTFMLEEDINPRVPQNQRRDVNDYFE